ncbi:uncharacterized protein LOC142237864 [Haematobia irritans]|uniref:uncharacterized protein LOC142237864 n=1 Tax=Haematobia irritans TaxID=7368 RepID=UPI003F4FBDCE
MAMMMTTTMMKDILVIVFIYSSKTTNKKQLDILISTMQLNVDIARGWSTRNKEEVNKVWHKLESELNAAGPPSKTVPEWKKVWCDQKKYVRHKAAQNFKSSHGTGGGPNMEQTFSATEEAIYNLINMKESVEGVAKTYGLGSSKQNPQSLQSGAKSPQSKSSTLLS